MPTKSPKGGIQSPRARKGRPLGVTPWPQNKKQGEKENKAREAHENPCRLASQEKGSSEQVPGESQKRSGPRKAPRRKRKKRDKTGKNKRGGTQKEKKNKPKQVRVGGVLLLPDLSLLKKTTTAKKPKEERTNPKNSRPDIKRIFPNSFGSEPPKKKQKHRQKTHQKTQDQQRHPKTKVRSRKFFFKKRP